MIFSLARLSLRRGLFSKVLKKVSKQVVQIFLGKRILEKTACVKTLRQDQTMCLRKGGA